MLTAKDVLESKKVIIFDLDGTLIDSEVNHLQGVWNVVKNLAQDNINIYQKIVEHIDLQRGRDKSVRKQVFLEFFPMIDFEDIDYFYWEGVGQCIKLFNGVEKTLIELQSQNKKFSIVTNGGRVQHKKIELLLKKLPESLVSFDYIEVTGDYGREKYKPNPYCLEKVIRKYGVSKDDVVYIGNTIHQDRGMCVNAQVDIMLFDPQEIFSNLDDVRFFSWEDLIEI
jgi:FMN phosphatase YigB (HAD superfamily)